MPDSKRLLWLGDTKADLAAASEPVRRTMGFAIRAAQEGSKSADASPLKGALREVVEVRENDEAGTHRLMYTVSLGDAVYVLDFFQKKSKSGIATPKIDVDRITKRLARAKRHHAESQKEIS